MLLSQARHDLGKGAYSLAAARVDAALREEASLADSSLDEFFMRATADDFVGRSEVIDALLDYRLAGLHTILFALNGSHLDSALDWSDEFLDRFPGDPGGLTLRSLALEFVGRYDEALIVCEELVERYPDDAASLQRRAAVHVSIGNDRGEKDEAEAERHFRLALRDYEALLAVDPDSVESLLQRGHLRLDLDEVDGALDDYARAASLEPDNVEARYARGVALEFTGSYEQALEDFDAVVRYDPDFLQGYFRRGNFLAVLGEDDRAGADFTRVLDVKPGDAEALLSRALATIAAAGDDSRKRDYSATVALYEQALVDLDATLEASPEDVTALWNRGLALRSLEEYDLAAEAFRRTLEVLDAPDDTHAELLSERGEALRLWGQALNVTERLEDAVHDFGAADDLAGLPWAVAAKGAALAALGRDDEAAEAFEQALAHDPGSVWARVSKAKLLHSLGRNEQALAELGEAASLASDTSDSGWVRVGRGLVLEAMGDEEAAAEAFGLALAAAKDAGAYIERGALFEDYGSAAALARAESDYRLALSIDPSSADVRNSLGWL